MKLFYLIVLIGLLGCEPPLHKLARENIDALHPLIHQNSMLTDTNTRIQDSAFIYGLYLSASPAAEEESLLVHLHQIIPTSQNICLFELTSRAMQSNYDFFVARTMFISSTDSFSIYVKIVDHAKDNFNMDKISFTSYSNVIKQLDIAIKQSDLYRLSMNNAGIHAGLVNDTLIQVLWAEHLYSPSIMTHTEYPMIVEDTFDNKWSDSMSYSRNDNMTIPCSNDYNKK